MDSFNPTDTKANSLTKEETVAAVAELYHGNPFPKVNRKFIDPQTQTDHKFALFSFVKSPGAQADKDGFFGVGKIRGSFFSKEEADQKAEQLIRDVDSTNSIFTCFMGAPFPLVARGFSSETTEIDLQTKVEKAIAENVREKRNQEKKEIQAIEERKNALMKDVDPETPEDPAEKYVEQRVKLSHLKYAIVEHAKKMEECKELKEKCVKFLKEQAAAHPEYETEYLDRYKKGRRAANIPEETDLTGFMKYMTESLDIEEI